MAFFSRNQKKLALCTDEFLNSEYEKSERNLAIAAKLGDEHMLKECMKNHRDFEYARLYKNTPEFKKKMRSNCDL